MGKSDVTHFLAISLLAIYPKEILEQLHEIMLQKCLHNIVHSSENLERDRKSNRY